MKMPEKPPTLIEMMSDKTLSGKALSREAVISYSNVVEEVNSRCLHWDEMRRPSRLKSWGVTDAGLLWMLAKMGRMGSRRTLPLLAKDQEPFHFWMPDTLLEGILEVDRNTSGEIEVQGTTGFPPATRYLMGSIIEEAIASSQLEGAATTRSVAKEMLRSGRSPRTRGERMILNNYKTILLIKEYLRDDSHKKLTIELLHDLHRTVTAGTLENRDDAGRFRTTDDIKVYDRESNTLLHDPPLHNELPERMQALLDFVNAESDQRFIPPVLRGIILHFMIGYEHPYVDGNGRLARAIFYWYMLSRGYWAMEYMAISKAILGAPAQYKMAYLYSETDGGDLTYFVLFNIKMIRKAIGQFQKYVAAKRQQLTQASGQLRKFPGLNHRQLALLDHALRHPGTSRTINSYAASNGVSRITARTDLYGLEKLDLLIADKSRKPIVFLPASDLEKRLETEA